MQANFNQSLPFIKKNWKGNPLNKGNQFVNLDEPSERGFQDLLKWQINRKEAKRKKINQFTNVQVIENTKFLNEKQDGITWLGHCTFLIQINEKKILTDPLFYDLAMLKRFTKLPCSVNDLIDIDYIILSHNHRDHCDKTSMKKVCQLNPNAIILTALGIEPLLRKWKITNKVQEAGWYQTYKINEQFKIHFLPSKHWARRLLTDLNTMLWGSFMIENTNNTIYFGADSGLGIHFSEIATLFPTINYALLGIGAYEPNWFMHTSHTSPEEAVIAFEQLGAKKMIPMHYGTFDLSDETMQEPLEKIIAMNRKDILPLTIGKKLPI